MIQPTASLKQSSAWVKYDANRQKVRDCIFDLTSGMTTCGMCQAVLVLGILHDDSKNRLGDGAVLISQHHRRPAPMTLKL